MIKMIRLLVWIVVAISVVKFPVPVTASLVDARDITSVYASAPFFDTRLGDENGCDPVGCVAELTRDGDSTTPTSRWSCSPELGPEGTICSITYGLDLPLNLQQLHVALYQGDMRQRTLEVYVEGVLVTNWTSSGTTTDFETIELPGTPAQMIELRGVMSRSEWLSVAEVEVMVYDSSTVEVGTLATVETSATYFETRTSDKNGYDPDGWEPSRTRDDDLSADSRWSCSPQLGGDCIITYNLGAVYELSELMLAFYGGNQRTRTVDVIIDGIMATTWTSSGRTNGFQRIDISGQSGQVVEIRGDLPKDDSWLSITETRIMVVLDGMPPSPAPLNPSTSSPMAPGAVPVTRTTGDGRLIVEAGELDWVVLSLESFSLYNSSTEANGGCDPIGCVKEYTRDGSLEPTSRWSCQFTPPSSSAALETRYQCRIFYNLRNIREIHAVRVAFHLGDEMTQTLEVWIDDVLYIEWTSSGTTVDFETIPMPSSGITGQDITIRAVLDMDEWVSITEVEIDVVVDDVPLLGVGASDRTTVTATASTGDPDVLLDGVIDDPASSWACSGVGCSVMFDLQAVEQLVQISIAFAEDGDIASNIFDVSVGIEETGTFTKVFTDVPSNKDRPLTPQQFRVLQLAQFIKIEPSALGSGSLDITEVDIRVAEEVPIRGVAADTSLDTVGVLPLWGGATEDTRTEGDDGCSTHGCGVFNVKDGDMSTFWRCYGSPEDPILTSGNFECEVNAGLFYYRHLKQIRIALPDGAERAIEMRFMARRVTDAGEQYVQESVLSSGLTDGFETYDFDVFTRNVEIHAVFNGVMESISIAEIEFLEEPWVDGVIPVSYMRPSSVSGLTRSYPEELRFENGLAWGDDEFVIGQYLFFYFAFYGTVTAIDLKFPVGQRYKFNLVIMDALDEYEGGIKQEGLESADQEGFQTFSLDFVPAGVVVERINIEMLGTVDGDDTFTILDAIIHGSIVDNPTNVYTIGSAAAISWDSYLYPKFVTGGSGDQKAIMGAMCEIKEATFDGLNCVGGNPDTTGEVVFPMGEYFLDGPVYVQSGIHLHGRFSEDDSPFTTDFFLEEGAAGNTIEAALVVFNSVENAKMEDIWIRGLYDPDTDSGVDGVSGFGSKCMEMVDSKNITARDVDIRNCDGNAITVVNSEMINIDAGGYDELLGAWSTSDSRGIGLLIEGSDSVWIRRHTLYNNGEAGLVIRDTRNVTFEATFDSFYLGPGQGNVGSLDGQQPIDVIVEGGSTMITFDHMRVTSTNEPAIIVAPDSTNVKLVECSFAAIESGACVIEAETPTVVNVTDSDNELTLQGECFVKV